MRTIRIAETTLVRDERVVILRDAIFSDFPPFCGTFIYLGTLNSRHRLLWAGRKVVTVACHWEGSEDGDDYLELMTFDQSIQIVQDYTGPVVSRIESIGQGEAVIKDSYYSMRIFNNIHHKIRRLNDG